MPLSSVVGAQSIIRPGVCTSSTRPASPYDGQVIYETDTDKSLVYNGTGWVFLSTSRANAGGLDLVKTQTVGTAVSTVTVSDAFSSTYENYKIVVTGGVSSASAVDIYMQLGATTTAYYSIRSGWRYAGTALNFVDANNGSNWTVGGSVGTDPTINMDILGPNLSKKTYFNGLFSATSGIANTAGYQDSTTQFTAFTLSLSSGTLTGGTIRVYGYVNS
jgi:hypothetical protein